jgi:hypothetical protein
MTQIRSLTLAVALFCASLAATPAAAQSSGSSSGFTGDRVFASIGVGLFKPRRDLNPKTDARLDRAVAIGGGVGLELTDMLAIRASLTRVRTEARERTPSVLNDTRVLRRYLDFDLLIGPRRREGGMPYASIGLSRVRTRQLVSRDPLSVSSNALKIGGGYEHGVAATPFAFFAEGAAYIHKLDRKPLNRRQFDVTLLAGLRLHF